MTALEWKKIYESEEFLKQYECPAETLGMIYTKENTRFRVWAPLADSVTLCFYEKGTDTENIDMKTFSIPPKISMNGLDNGIFECLVEGDCHGLYYTYQIERDGTIIETQDPYAVAVGANGKRSMVIDLALTNPVGWKQDENFERTATGLELYELHVKDFSNDIHSGIREDYRGKYLAFTESNTSVDGQGEYTSGMAYLKELGITHVHLLPTYDFGSIDETGDSDQFNWGYDPVNYNVPEGSYATDCYHGEVRIFEFKKMVKAFHDAGIGVVLDMVFNHTFSTDSAFQKTAPYYYYRQNEDGTFADASACGNETCSERAMYRKYMVESVLYWAREYHIDGFRFDLMGIHDVETMNEIRRALNRLPGGEKIIMYGEPWYANEAAMKEPAIPAIKANVRELNEDIAIFHDDIRDAIKGSVFEAREGGFVNGGSNLENEIAHAACAYCDDISAGHPKSPKQVIRYVSAHDNYTLWDKLAATMMENPEYEEGTPEMISTNKMVAAMIQFGLGTPFFQAGEEFLRTKYGEDNSFRSSPKLNQLDWLRRVRYHEVVEYYRGLIALRKKCPIFTCQDMESVSEIKIERADNQIVAYQIEKTGYYQWRKLFVVFNASSQEQTVLLPNGVWQVLVDEKSSTKMNEAMILKEDLLEVAPHSACICGFVQEYHDRLEEKMNEAKNAVQKTGGKMMDILTKVSEKISETGKKAAETAKDQAEILSLKTQMLSCDKQVSKMYEEIGKMVFSMDAENETSPYADQIAKIKEQLSEKEKMQQKIDLIKSV